MRDAVVGEPDSTVHPHHQPAVGQGVDVVAHGYRRDAWIVDEVAQQQGSPSAHRCGPFDARWYSKDITLSPRAREVSTSTSPKAPSRSGPTTWVQSVQPLALVASTIRPKDMTT